jgi:hypothetical protein
VKKEMFEGLNFNAGLILGFALGFLVGLILWYYIIAKEKDSKLGV